jgi:biopolymer transport protein ExbB
MLNHLFKLPLFLLAITLCGFTPAQAWWNSQWTSRKKITLNLADGGLSIKEPVANAVVLIRLHDGNFQFSSAKDDGSDLRFVASDDKTLLAYHIEKYDSLMSEAFVWVRIPNIKPGEKTEIWLYSGGGEKATRVDDPKGTYDSDTVLVYHFAEHNQPAHDFSANGNTSQNSGTESEGSMIGTGLRLDGKGILTIPDSPALAWNGNLTWTAWIRSTTLTSNALLFSRKEGSNTFRIGAHSGVPFVEINGQRSGAGTPITVNTWHHLAVVAESSTVTLYLDGEVYGTLNTALPALTGACMLGGEPSPATDTTGWNGEIDELQIAKIARSASWIKFAASTQGEKSSTVLSFGEDEQTHNWFEGGTFGVIVKSLTVDGWVVICILGVMSAVSWWVMITKVGYLNSIGKGNAIFMAEWRHVASDLSSLDHGNPEQTRSLGGRLKKDAQKAIRQASVYRIFHIGAEEIRHRLSTGHNKYLSAESIAAIRASLDTGLVHEIEKLQAQVVFLTIAISGGPFLGLLGTVVGVMITFASIAQAGDVNVNAIAPGIAAALLATIAGLAVAIPALFGYNYILSRVKSATTDMQVFVDEFVTRLAEFYRPPQGGTEDDFEEGTYASSK